MSIKSILYKNPVSSTVTVNVLALFIFIYLITNGSSIGYILLVLIGGINGRIINNSLSISKQKKIVIYSSFFLMMALSLGYAFYLINFI